VNKGEGCSSDMNVLPFWCKKLRCFKTYSMSARTKRMGFEAVRIFFGQGESIFRDFVQMPFLNGLFLEMAHHLQCFFFI